MRTMLKALGLVIGLTVLGCGLADEGPHEFKPTDTKQFEDMKKQMIGNMTTKAHTKNKAATPAPGASGAAPAEKTK